MGCVCVCAWGGWGTDTIGFADRACLLRQQHRPGGISIEFRTYAKTNFGTPVTDSILVRPVGR